MRVWVDSTNFVIAESARDALDMACDNVGVPRDADAETLEENGLDALEEWHSLPDDKELDIGSDDPDWPRRKMTCAEWCRVEGRGLLGSSEW